MSETSKANALKTLSPSRREMELEIPAEEVSKEYEKTLSSYAAKAKIPGFRPGLAPREMVKRLFDEDIRKDIVDAVVPRVLSEELRAYRLNPVSVPYIQDLDFRDGQPLRCRVLFEVLPDFDLPDYRTIRVQSRRAEVEESEVDKALDELRKKSAEYIPVEGRGVEDGDYVSIEIQGRDLQTRKLLPIDKAVVLAGHAENEKSLNEKLGGMKAGEERRFVVTYEGSNPNRKLAGKTIEYRLKALDIKERKLPPLSDELARTVGEYKDLAALKEAIRSRLLASRESARRTETATEILGEIAARLSLELPASLVEEESRAILQRLVGASPGVRPDAETMKVLAAEARKQAERTITNHLVLEKIAEKEGLGITEEEIREEVRVLAIANNMSESGLWGAFQKDNRRREDLRESLLFRKTVDFLMKNAIMK